jgi:hypothetical protein
MKWAALFFLFIAGYFGSKVIDDININTQKEYVFESYEVAFKAKQHRPGGLVGKLVNPFNYHMTCRVEDSKGVRLVKIMPVDDVTIDVRVPCYIYCFDDRGNNVSILKVGL